ncbi:MAG: GlmU family protein [Cyclobacteriaceae bacterium]|nr:GlmU family protein [Cyclobacteriaceae bacterium]
MNIILFDDPVLWEQLLPLTYTRPCSELRCGILTLTEKWNYVFETPVSWNTQPYLSEKYPANYTKDNLFINGSLCPDPNLLRTLKDLAPGESLKKGEVLLATRSTSAQSPDLQLALGRAMEYKHEITLIDKPWKIFKENAGEIKKDFEIITKNRTSQKITDKHTAVYGAENIFLEEGVSIKASVIDAENGPIYLGKNSVISPGSIIRGSFALGENAQLAMGTKIRGDSTVGPHSKVGGEVGNSVVMGYSNKAHEGYLGNSVIGEWCNIGADSNTSNMKNNYANVKVWDYHVNRFVDTGEVFCGLIMGDHSKCGINTMFNTGTSIGVSCNIFGSGYPRNFIPSFSWGGAHGFKSYPLKGAAEVAEISMTRRNKVYDEVESRIFAHLYDFTANQRRY